MPFIHLVEQYNAQHGFQEVSFTARERGKQVSAMYLPSTGSTRRVVVVHGRQQHGLSSTAQAAGYFLRLMGISAFIVPWGVLGGPLDPQRVALMGFDYGGFSCQQAFATELGIPALLLDGVVHNFQADVVVVVVATVVTVAPNIDPNHAMMFVAQVFRDVDALQPLFTSQVQSRCELNLQQHMEQVNLNAAFASRSSANKSYIGDTMIPSEAQQIEELKASVREHLSADSLLLMLGHLRRERFRPNRLIRPI
eukprot:g13451.t1